MLQEKKMKIWKKIKKHWKWIAGGVIALFAIITALTKSNKLKTVEKIQEKIDDNEKKIERVKGKEDQVKTQKRQVKKDLVDLKKMAKKTKTTKRKPAPKKTTSKAKQNIVSKTKRKK